MNIKYLNSINDMHDASDVGTFEHMLSFGVGVTAIIQKVLKNILGNIWTNDQYNTSFSL